MKKKEAGQASVLILYYEFDKIQNIFESWLIVAHLVNRIAYYESHNRTIYRFHD